MEMDDGLGAPRGDDPVAGGGTGRLLGRRRRLRTVGEAAAIRANMFDHFGPYRLAAARVKPEPYPYGHEYDCGEPSRFRAAVYPDYDEDRLPMHECPMLPVKRRLAASSSAAAVNPLRRASLAPTLRRFDPVAPAATPPNGNASPAAAGAVPSAAVPAPRSAATTLIAPPNVGQPAPAATRFSPRARSCRFTARRSTLLSSAEGVMWNAGGLSGGSGSVVSAPNAAAAAALGKYCQDMTAQASKLDPVIGRDEEIDRIVCILCRRTKNSAMLVGAPGVGKTAIVEGLAQRIAAGAVPAALAGARVLEVDLGAMVAGTRYRGMFEERIKKVIKEAEAADGKVVLFIDEVHMLLGAGQGKDGSMDGANLLKPALARGRIRCVGATTFDEYRKYVEKDAAFERRFQKVHIQEPSVLATIAILQGLKMKYEEHHGTRIQDAAIVAAAQLANRYITDLKNIYIPVESGRQFPDKAIDLIDEACATAWMQTDNILKESSTQHVSENATTEAVVSPGRVAESPTCNFTIAVSNKIHTLIGKKKDGYDEWMTMDYYRVVSRWTGIPVNTLNQEEKEKLMHLADRLRERVVGQETAVNLVAQAVLRSRAGLDQPDQPIGSFLFLGSTGVGKTELAKALAEQLFDNEKMLIRFDMTEFVGSHSALRLIGAPPSYHGHEDGGQLTEKVRKQPYSVILFDEIEKADPAVVNVLLQLLDDGVLTDGKGRTVDFKNTIIIMTSNLGAESLMEAVAGENSMEVARDAVVKQAQKHFRPEFLNRLSELVIFEPLSQNKLREVAEVQMKGIIARAGNKGITLSVSNAALDVVLSESHNPLYGARPIKRWLQKNVMTKLSEMLFKGQIDADTTVFIEASEDKKDLKYDVIKNTDEREARRRDKMPLVEIPSDSDSDEDINPAAPVAKKMKGVELSSPAKK
ncbi:hypothetical protein HU200_043460 [Digitaria exilis]|uniref:Uncharacterized protein n=1 Tax=Digitaria exilis TaxID=1010633 RepID=A0A835B8V7_9POAL|nr:hypothetical protein HU200_043460 [Digitaria exilis]